MSQNITLLGASYSAVPAVTLPKTGGGTATFTDVTDTTAAAGDVASGKYFYTSAGVRTQGTASGGGGSSLNFQVSNTAVRLANKTTLTDTGLTLTVNATGKYNVYWSAFRTNTSSGYTWGTQLHIGSSSYGSENTSWTNSYNQVNKLTNVSLTKDQVLRIYGRTRSGNSYYICCSNLVIEQTS